MKFYSCRAYKRIPRQVGRSSARKTPKANCEEPIQETGQHNMRNHYFGVSERNESDRHSLGPKEGETTKEVGRCPMRRCRPTTDSRCGEAFSPSNSEAILSPFFVRA